MDSIRELEQFYSYISDSQAVADSSYLHINGNGYDYLYKIDPKAAEVISGRINGDSPIQDLFLESVIHYSTRFPRFTGLLPRFGIRNLTLPANDLFDCAIIGNRIKTIHIESGNVYTVITSRNDEFKEVDRRQTLPPSINVPRIISVDHSYPYFVEEFVEGSHPETTQQGLKELFDALHQLTAIHQSGTESPVDTDTFLDAIRHNTENRLAHRAVEVAKSLPTPDSLRRGPIHGDLHRENLLRTDEGTYILDWEDADIDFIFSDFFMYFEAASVRTGNVELLTKMVTEDENSIANKYAELYGPTAYGSSQFLRGLPLLYLLHRFETGDGSDRIKQILCEVLDNL